MCSCLFGSNRAMATSELYKLDGDSYPSNSFPIRSFFHQRKEGAGHWLVAHRTSVENRYRGGQSNNLGHRAASNSILSESTRVEDLPGNILDGHLLMTLHCVDKPSDLCSVNISEQRLNSVKPEDFVDFINVAYINASDNSLPIEPFGNLPFLRELELALNRLSNVTVKPDAFPHLEMLDLSYNNLSLTAIMSLGLLPCLKVLHLTGNGLQALPPDLAGLSYDHSQLAAHDGSMRFRALEVLMLDDNKLSSGVFSSLANLRRLRHLNLQGNNISEVPYLQQKVFSKQNSEEQALGHYRGSDVVGSGTKEATDLSDDSKHKSDTIKNNSEEELQDNSQSHLSFNPVDIKEFSGPFTLPLPELNFLNIANNKIAEEEALLAVSLFPVLTELVIHSNPLTTQRTGDPPLLTYFLQERLGIQIQRKKTQRVMKPPLILSLDSKLKVKTKIRKVPKVPLLTAAPSSSSDDHGPPEEEEEEEEDLCVRPLSQRGRSPERAGCSSPARFEEREEASAGGREGSLVRDGADEPTANTHQDGQTFFVTQVTDLPGSDYRPLLDQTLLDQTLLDQTEYLKEVEKQKLDAISEKFKGYEILWDTKADPSMVEPVGIQLTVRMLELALQNPLVYRDSQPKLHGPQKPFIEKERKVGILPAMIPRKQREERVQEMLLEMKERTITKVPLDHVLKGKDVPKAHYDEALSLLRDMKKKYKGVHMKAVEQAAHMESEGITTQAEHPPHSEY